MINNNTTPEQLLQRLRASKDTIDDLVRICKSTSSTSRKLDKLMKSYDEKVLSSIKKEVQENPEPKKFGFFDGVPIHQ